MAVRIEGWPPGKLKNRPGNQIGRPDSSNERRDGKNSAIGPTALKSPAGSLWAWLERSRRSDLDGSDLQPHLRHLPQGGRLAGREGHPIPLPRLRQESAVR